MNSRTLTILLLAIIAVLLIAGSSAVYFIGVYQPGQLRAQATAISSAMSTGTAHSDDMSTVQARGTAGGFASATAGTNAQATSIVSATHIASQDVYVQATSGKPIVQDKLAAQGASKWDEDSFTDNTSGQFLGSCGFSNGGYDARAAAGQLQICQAQAQNYSDLTYEMQIMLVQGHSGGIVLRSDANLNGYYFRISTDGTYIFKKIRVVNNSEDPTTLASGQSSLIATGNKQPNVLTVVAKGNNFYLYIDQQYVNSATDASYKSGKVGVYVDSDVSAVEAMFQNVKVWKA